MEQLLGLLVWGQERGQKIEFVECVRRGEGGRERRGGGVELGGTGAREVEKFIIWRQGLGQGAPVREKQKDLMMGIAWKHGEQAKGAPSY